jgi:CDP-2,3-bis-(O-geranylgeranyl)-sn-glycerol synthase
MTEFWRDILFVLWVFAPAGIANMVPILAARVPVIKHFDQPIDAGRSFRGKRIFGDHKTWRGILTGVVAATAILALQQLLYSQYGWFQWISQDIDYMQLPTWLVGPLFGIGALGGDAAKSFFKRQLNVAPGKSWFPYDQLDYVVGGALAVAPFIRFSPGQYVLLVVIWLAIHVAATHIGYWLRLKESPI